IGTVNLLTNQITGGNPLTYTDVTPIAMLVHEYVVFAVNIDSAIRDARDFIERVRRDPASVSVGFSPGLGAAAHISYGLVAQAASADLRKLKTVVFKSGGEATTALLGGHIDCAVAAIPGVLPHLKAGKLRVIAVPAPRRLTGDLANVPTWNEIGVNAVFTNWRGVFGPPGLTPEQIAYWDRVLEQVVHTDEWKSVVAKFNQEEAFTDAQGARTFLRKQHEVLKSVLTDLGLAKQ
ncbi:MAG TPA: tripartite tricarboxylate transporter substrate binding protein, partial [Burkholderiales bacterium]|nr:tripartite tricarboxylate transporter substrate binding protein [Burkholderiales bacterium]